MYAIYSRQIKKAKELGVQITPSNRKNKKLSVYTLKGEKICDIGDLRYLDYCQYKELYGLAYAEERKRAYWLRHKKDSRSKCGFYSARILWS